MMDEVEIIVPPAQRATSPCWWHPVLLALLPLALLAADPRWLSSGLFLDPYIYLGYYLDLPGHLQAFPDHYISTRLPALMPGWLVYQLLPTVAANAALHLGLLYLAVALAYRLLVMTAGARTALLVCAVLVSNPFFLSAIGTDYTDGYAVTPSFTSSRPWFACNRR
jgi:hypothetical protein